MDGVIQLWVLFSEILKKKANPAQGSGKPEIFMNYRGINFYFETKYDLEQAPRKEDVYKVLAYMNNYDVPCGVLYILDLN